MTTSEEKKNHLRKKETATININALEQLNDKLDKTIERIAALENKIEKMSPDLHDATGTLNMTLALLRTFQEVTNVATIFSPSRWILRHKPNINLDAIERSIVDVLTREGPKNISQLTSAVKMERGSASRRIIREKVNILIEKDLLEEVDERYGRVVKMKLDIKELTA